MVPVLSRKPRRAISSAPWMRRLGPCLGVPVILAGCLYHYGYVPHSNGGASLDRSEPSPDLVQVVTAEEVDRPYRKIGIVHAPSSLQERDAIVALKRRARTLGGDALLDVRRRGSGSTADRASSDLAAAPWEAAVIVWTDAEVGGAPKPPPGVPPPREPPRRRAAPPE